MKAAISSAVLLAFATLMLVGCGGNTPPQAQDQSAQLAAGKPRSTPRRDADNARVSAPSRDAQWTIEVHVIRTPAHVAESKRLKDDLIATTGLKDWYLVHGETESRLYHGYYRHYEGDDPAAVQARADLAAVRDIKDVRGVAVFRNAQFTPIFSPEPEAPPEWNLVNSGGYWSLQIAAYRDHPDRKQAAVDSVREARAQGIEAYYYHGERVSSVCIGAWPREAFEQGESEVNNDPMKRVVVTNQNLPEPMARAMELEGKKNNEIVLTNQGRVRDKTLEAAMKQYPYHYVNDAVFVSKVRNPVTGKIVEVPDSSFLVVVPKQQGGVLDQHMAGDQKNRSGPRQPVDVGQAVYGERQQPAQPAQRGRLRSIGE